MDTKKEKTDNSLFNYLRMFAIGMGVLGIGFLIALLGYMLTQK